MNLLLRSRDNGVTWEGPEETGMTEGIVPSIKELSNGDLIVGLTEQWPGQRGNRGFCRGADVLSVRRPGTDVGGAFQGARPRRFALHRGALAFERGGFRRNGRRHSGALHARGR